MRISDWSSDVCSSDLVLRVPGRVERLDAAKAPLHGLARRRLARCPAGNRRAHRLAELVQQGVVVEGVVDRGGHGGLGREGSVASSCRRADRRARAKWGKERGPVGLSLTQTVITDKRADARARSGIQG